MTCAPRSFAAALLASLIAVSAVVGQTPSLHGGGPVHDASADQDLLIAIYQLGAPARQIMIAADRTAWPVFVGTAPSLWLVAAIDGGSSKARQALSVSMAQGTAIATSLVLKRVVGRPRPYTRMPSIEARSGPHKDGSAKDPYSFPSGHAAMSFSIATAVALEAERWFVTIPAMIWATSVSLSRVWLGVHYPSDVLVGALLGVGAAVLSHYVADALIAGNGADAMGTAGIPVATIRL